jgi:hypothetical protein
MSLQFVRALWELPIQFLRKMIVWEIPPLVKIWTLPIPESSQEEVHSLVVEEYETDEESNGIWITG